MNVGRLSAVVSPVQEHALEVMALAPDLDPGLFVPVAEALHVYRFCKRAVGTHEIDAPLPDGTEFGGCCGHFQNGSKVSHIIDVCRCSYEEIEWVQRRQTGLRRKDANTGRRNGLLEGPSGRRISIRVGVGAGIEPGLGPVRKETPRSAMSFPHPVPSEPAAVARQPRQPDRRQPPTAPVAAATS